MRDSTCTPHSLHLSRLRRAALLVVLLALAGTASAQLSRVLRRRPVLVPRTTVQVSHDLGDLGYDWGTSLTYDPGEKIVCRWSTTHTGATGAVYQVLDTQNQQVLAQGGLNGAPPSGGHRLFFIHLAQVPSRPSYLVRLQARGAGSQLLGSPSAPCTLTRASSSPITQFTDVGLSLGIQSRVESIRAKHDVPALGGIIVTRQGVEAIAVDGVRKHGNSAKVTELDRWHLGSCTKAMTATLVGILAQRGQVAWNTSISEAFPGWASTMNAGYRDMTFFELCGHRAGVPNELTDAEYQIYNDANRSVVQRRRDTVYKVLHRSPISTPGTTYAYSNIGYVIVGAMLEELMGRSWEQLMQAELFSPLGMTSAGFGPPGSTSFLNAPWGHQDTATGRTSYHHDNTAAHGPAGTVHASLRDWAKFIRLHLTGSQGNVTLHPWTLTRLHTELPPPPDDPKRYGWGWGMSNPSSGGLSGLVLDHNGTNTMWFAVATIYQDMGFAVLTVSNIGGKEFGPGNSACYELRGELVNYHLGH
jgi:CubicO group peptidase (beta-lactamase class C family)